MSSNSDKVKQFFSAPQFAVAGASQDQNKFGYRILAWYVAHGLPVVPINPKTASITVQGHSLECVKDVKDLPDPASTSLSVVTPPGATSAILKDAKAIGVKAVWLQPGTYNDAVLEYAKGEFEAGIGGEDGGAGSEGWCVLVDGEDGMRQASRL